MTIMNSGTLVSQDNDNVPTVDDIGRGLARQIRFGGQPDINYSVLQHTMVVAAWVPTHMRIFALLHDATECVMGDTPRPWKHPEVTMLERDLQERISKSYGLPWPWPPDIYKAVHEADMAAACAEALVLYGSSAKGWCRPWHEPNPRMVQDTIAMLPFGKLWMDEPTEASAAYSKQINRAIKAWEEVVK